MRARVGCPLGSETNAGGHPPRAWRIGSGVGYPPLPAPRSTHDTYEQLHLVFEPGRGMWIRYGEVWNAR